MRQAEVEGEWGSRQCNVPPGQGRSGQPEVEGEVVGCVRVDPGRQVVAPLHGHIDEGHRHGLKVTGIVSV